MPIARMQWWMRPGPSRACAIAKPPPSSPRRYSAGTRTSSKSVSQCPPPASWPNTGKRAHDRDARRVERHEDHRVPAVRVGVGIGDAHEDRERAAGRRRAARPPLVRVDHVVVAVALDATRRCWWRRGARPTARSSRSTSGSRRRAADRGTAPVAAAWRTGGGAPCCRCRAPSSSSPRPTSGLRPMSSQSGAYSRLVSPIPCSVSGRNRFHRPRRRASAFSSSITGGWKCGSPDSRTCSWYVGVAGSTSWSMNSCSCSRSSSARGEISKSTRGG